MIEQDEEDETQARFKVAKGFDFSQTINWKLFEAMHQPRSSSKRAASIKDLDLLLSPDRNEKYDEGITELKAKLQPNGETAITNYEAYSDGLLEVLLKLMKAKGYTGGMDADIADDEL